VQKGVFMVDVLTPRIKVKNTMRIMMVYGTSVMIASLVYWSIGYLLFTGA
jgi:ammonia channel protein AmtB